MKVLLDTHALLWGVLDHPRLSLNARSAMLDAETEVLISAVSIFEIMQKYRLGKLNGAEPFVRRHRQILAEADWTPLPISLDHADVAGSLEIPHKDPFDRLLIAQALVERVPLISNETLFDAFGIERIW